tara:strand:- start:185 stop:955 length:771 start_codon:yes stop_codon:yes gene_type:complete
MAIHTNADTKMFISPTPVDVDSINAMTDQNAIAFFDAIDDWIEVEELEDLGELGDTSEAITFTALNNARVRKLKGPRDAGTQAIVVGRDPLDDGQEALIAAEKTKFDYAVKLELADARTDAYSNSVMYYGAMIMNAPTNLGNVSNVVRRNFSAGINTAVFEVGSAILAAPTNTLEPSIAGVLAEDEVLTAIEGTWTGSPTFTYVWNRDGTPIGGATSKTYTIVAADVGTALSVTVTGTNSAGNASATSAETANIPA